METPEQQAALVAAGVLALLLGCDPLAVSGAPTIDGVAFPPTLAVDGRVLHLNGVELRTVTLLRVHAYVAALYLETPSHDNGAIEASTEIKARFYEFLRAASKEQVQELLRRDETEYCAAAGCPASDAQDIERLVVLFPAVKPGDHATYVFSSRCVRMLMNNAPLVAFGSPDFVRRFLDAVIGPHAKVQSVRHALLGHP